MNEEKPSLHKVNLDEGYVPPTKKTPVPNVLQQLLATIRSITDDRNDK